MTAIKTAFIGLGTMGYPMAGYLANDWDHAHRERLRCQHRDALRRIGPVVTTDPETGFRRFSRAAK